ncbi:F0F1 ATP synthase subunit delta, partial [Myxococcota bacterium]|nr:F0F1 ATP synthase subunit delta [Myxococcota bacterium]
MHRWTGLRRATSREEPMPITEVASRRYATALMDVATERGALKQCLAGVEKFRDTVLNNVELG